MATHYPPQSQPPLDSRPKFQRRNHGGNQGPGGGPSLGYARAHRQALDPEVEEATKLASLITVAGDKPQQAVALIHDMALVMVRDFDRFNDTIVTTFVGCCAEFAHKPHVYAALLSSITHHDPHVGATLLGALHSHLAAAFLADRVAHLRSMSRVLGLLADLGALNPASLVDSLLLPLATLLTDGILDNRRDVYVTVITAAVMFSPTALAPYRAMLLGPVVQYAQARAQDPRRVAVLDAVRPMDPAAAAEGGVAQGDWLADYVAGVVHLFPLDGLVPATPVPLAAWVRDFAYPPPSAAAEGRPAAAADPLTLPPVDLGVPSDRSLLHFDAPPLTSFRILTDGMTVLPGFPADHPSATAEFIPGVPQTGSIERIVCTDMVNDLLINIQFNHKAGVRTLLDLKLMFAAGTFTLDADEALVVGDNQGMHPTRPEFHFEQLVMELVLMALFRLPAPQVRPVFYTDVIMGLCRVSPKRAAQALGKCLHVLFGRLESTDVDCLVRLVDLFSHHVSNFSYGWRWADWAFALPDSPTAASLLVSEGRDAHKLGKRRTMLLSVLERITRLAYFERIKQVLPAEFQRTYARMHPDVLGEYATPELADMAARLHALLQSRAAHDQVMALATTQLGGMTDAGMDPMQAIPLVRRAFVTALLTYGETLSHKVNVLERYVPVLKDLAPAQDASARVDLVDVVHRVFRKNRQSLVIVLDKLLQHRLVVPDQGMTWLKGAVDVYDAKLRRYEERRMARAQKGVAEDMDVAAEPPAAAGDEGNNGGDAAVAEDKMDETGGEGANDQQQQQQQQQQADEDEEEDFDEEELSPMFVLEILCLFVKKALYRVDALEEKVAQVTSVTEEEGTPSAVRDQQVAILQTNLEKAQREKNDLFVRMVEFLLARAAAEVGEEGQQPSNNQYTSWSLGSLLTLLRMYVADIPADVREQMVALIQAQSQAVVSDKMKSTLVAVFSLE